MEFFDNLDPMLRTYWFIALPVSLIFVIQAIMTFVGMDSSDGLDADFDGDMNSDSSGAAPFQLFSFRNLVNFLLGFSWGGIAFFKLIPNKFMLGAVAFVIGAIFLMLFFLIIRQLKKLEEDNSFKLPMSVGKTGNVYLTIPASKTDSGIVQVSVNGTLRELKAVTPGDKIESGTLIRVTGIESDTLIIVERLQ